MDDLRHIMWLFKQSFINLCEGDINGSIEALYWIKIHMTYPHRRIK